VDKKNQNVIIFILAIIGGVLLFVDFYTTILYAMFIAIPIIIILVFYYMVKPSFQARKSSSYSTNYNTLQPKIRKSWNEFEKEQIRIRQDGKCAICQKPPPRWEYDHIDGNRENNELSNCQGLCPNCHSVKTHES